MSLDAEGSTDHPKTLEPLHFLVDLPKQAKLFYIAGMFGFFSLHRS